MGKHDTITEEELREIAIKAGRKVRRRGTFNAPKVHEDKRTKRKRTRKAQQDAAIRDQ